MNSITKGERVKILRKDLGLTLEKFGERLGVTKVAISKIEKGIRNLTNQMAKAICREYHVNYEWLVNGDGEMFSDNDDLIDRMIQIMESDNILHKELVKSVIYLDGESLTAIQTLINYSNIGHVQDTMNKKTD